MAKIGEAVNMEDSTSNPDLLHIAIDPEGDVLLELADRQLQVSSKLMSIASTVFKALFGPAFAEGSLRSSEHVIRVLLPDDDEEAMTALCSILHYRFDLVPKKLHSDVLEELALLADKYDCVNALSMWSAQHLAGLLEQEEHVDYNTKLLPAYYFNDAKAFRQITKAMVYESEKPRINRPFVLPTFGLGKRTRDTLPEGLLATIARKEWEIKTSIFQDIDNLFQPLLDKNLPNDGALTSHSAELFSLCDHKTFASYTKVMYRGLDLWPVATTLKIKSLGDVLLHLDPDAFSPPVGAHRGCISCNLDVQKQIAKIKKEATYAFSGLCLDCVKCGGVGKVKGGKCRFNHQGFLGIVHD